MTFDPSSPIDAAYFSAVGACPVLLCAATDAIAADIQAVRIGIDLDGSLRCSDPDAFDILITVHPGATAPWTVVTGGCPSAYADTLAERVRQAPVAATILARLLRIGAHLPFNDALYLESLAYSTLLGGHEFRGWLEERRLSPDAEYMPGELVSVARDGDHIVLTLNNPDQGNPMTAAMRGALYTALANVCDDPSKPTVQIIGVGRSFSTGGHLPEFGHARDLAAAHIVRTVHGCTRLIHQLGDRASVLFHGAAIGSGLEVFAAAAKREATPQAWFQLPELTMGLIPGAGGTVSVARAIGRHRTMWMATSGKRLTARQAAEMGLIHAIVAP